MSSYFELENKQGKQEKAELSNETNRRAILMKLKI